MSESSLNNETRPIKFIVDNNVGKLAKWLRMMGYDTAFFDEPDDNQMVRIALRENRIIITKDTGVMKRRVITTGRIDALLIIDDQPTNQIKQVVHTWKLDCNFRPFSLCLECNRMLEGRTKEEVTDLVPPYVYKTQVRYMQCPNCYRVYWPGTHWLAMVKRLNALCSPP